MRDLLCGGAGGFSGVISAVVVRRGVGRALRHVLALAGAGALVLAFVAGSAAAETGVSLPRLAVAPAGDSIAAWTENLGPDEVVQAAQRSAGGAWQAPVTLSAPGVGLGDVAIGPGGDAVAVWLRVNGTDRIVQAASRPAGGTWQAPVDLSAPGRHAAYPRVAVGAGGVAYAVWVSDYLSGNEVVQAAARSAGGSWQAPVDLSARGRVSDDPPRLAVNPAGDAVAVWGWQAQSSAALEVLQAASRSAGGTWQAPVIVSTAGHPADDPQVAINSKGLAYAVWRDPTGSGFVQAAARPAGGAWQTPVDLSTPDQNSVWPQLALNSAGDAVAVWQATPAGDLTEDHAIVQAAARSGRAVTRFWQAPVKLSGPGPAGVPDVALDTAGDAVAVWADNDLSTSNSVVRAAARLAASGVWQAPVTLSAADQNDSGSPQIALDSAGDAVAVWECGNGFTFPSALRAAAGTATSGVWQAPVNLSAPGCVATAHVPDVVGWSKRFAGQQVSAAGLVPRFTGATTATISYVATETPAPDTRVAHGSTVTLYLKPGEAP